MCKIFQSKYLHTNDLWIIIKLFPFEWMTKKIYSTVLYFVFILYPFFIHRTSHFFPPLLFIFRTQWATAKAPSQVGNVQTDCTIFSVRSSHFPKCSGWCKRGHNDIMKPKVSGKFVSWLFESLRQISAWFNDWYLVSHCSDTNSMAFGIFHWFKMSLVSLHILKIPLC